MILINPKIIRDIGINLNLDHFDTHTEGARKNNNSRYTCIITDDGSIILHINNINNDRVTLTFDGSKYVNIVCEDGRYKVFVMDRWNEGDPILINILRNNFNVDI